MAFKMNGMQFGMGTAASMGAGAPEAESMYNKNKPFANLRNKISSKLKDDGVTGSGDKIKSKSGINLLGQKRDVKKYYDPDTGGYLGKKVEVTKKDDTKKQYGGGLFGPNIRQDAKIKTVNPGLSKSGGVGKIRQGKGYFGDKTPDVLTDQKKSTSSVSKPKGRVEYASSKPELKEFVKTDDKGKKSISTYNQAWDDGRFTSKDGKRTDKFGNTYSDDDAGKKSFIQASKKFWADQAKTDSNESLLVDSQTGKKQVYSPNKYSRFGRKKKK